MNRIITSVKAAAPLLLNGYALVANVGLSSVLGIVFWMLATRLYSQDQVGLAAALISLMTTLSYFSQMNMGSFLTRFLPLAHADAGRLILKTYAAAGVLSAMVGTALAIGVGSLAQPLDVIRNNPRALALFVAATVIWTIFSLQDAALSGLRRSVLVPIENAAYSVLKIIFLVVLAMFIVPEPGGIFLAWILPLLPLVIIINVMIYWRLRNTNSAIGVRGPDLRTATRFLGWDFVGSLALSAAYGIAPILVTASAGVAATATYHLAWSIAYSVYLVGCAMSVSLVAEGAANPLRLRRLIADTLCHTLLLVLGAMLVLLAAAPLTMGLFGQSYVSEGTPVLRILLLSCLPWAVTTIYCAAARARGHTFSVAVVQVGTLLVFIAVSAVLGSGYGAKGVALAWLIAHSSACIGVAVSVRIRDGSGAMIDWVLALATSAAQLLEDMHKILRGTGRDTIGSAAGLLCGVNYPGLAGLTPVALDGSQSDVKAVLLKSDAPNTDDVKAVLKYATNELGTVALHRNAQVLRTLSADKRLDPYHKILPEILLEETTSDGSYTIETAVPGIEGRQLLRDAKYGKAAMAIVASTMADIHRRTSKLYVIDDAWAEQWIDEPINAIAASKSYFGIMKNRTTALEMLRCELRNVFVGREKYLGLGHGDLWPGNLFFSTLNGSEHNINLTGLIDWDTSRTDAIAAVDACHLGLTFRMVQVGEELGPVVRHFLLNGGWTVEEIETFQESGFSDEFGHLSDQGVTRAIVLLTWLQHVATILRKSDRISANYVWVAVNVDRVLQTISHTSAGVRR